MKGDGFQGARPPEGPNEGPLSQEERALVRVSAAIPTREAAWLRSALSDALEVVPGIRLEEVLLQSHLFVGYPTALEALNAWRDLRGEEPRAPTEADPGRWEVRGPRVCARVYGGQYDALLENIRTLHPAVERWMVVDGYGKVLGRPGLPLAVRELCIVALLAVHDAPDQLYSHLRGALNVGASPEAVDEALKIAGECASEGVRLRALKEWARVRARWRRRQEGEGSDRGDASDQG